MEQDTYRTGKAYTASEYTLWCLQMRKWADCADEDFLAYIRQRELRRVCKWLADAGLLDLKDQKVRQEIERCKESIHLMPRFDQIRPGLTTWLHRARKAPHTPPPLPKWAKKQRKG